VIQEEDRVAGVETEQVDIVDENGVDVVQAALNVSAAGVGATLGFMRGRMASAGVLAALALVGSGGPSCGGDHGGNSIDDAGKGGDVAGEGAVVGGDGGPSNPGGSSGGSSGGLGSGGAVDSGSGNADSSFGGGTDASSASDVSSGGACLGDALLGALGKLHLMVGVSTPPDMMGDATATAAPFDVRYLYISGGLFDGSAPCVSCASGCTSNGKSCANAAGGCAWWGCYQYDQHPPGEYVRSFDSTCKGASPSQIPMYTYYEILQTAIGMWPSFQEGQPEVTQAATSVPLMARYFADWRFLLQQIGQDTSILHIEPDFWGYAQQVNSDPMALTAAVASANAIDCAAMPNTIAGLGKCMVAMARKYAPHSRVGLHASAWGSNMDVALNTSPSLDVVGEARKVAAFLTSAGEADADLIIVEASDRDAGYYQSTGKNTWWDATNTKLPTFHQDFAWVKALTEALGKPALYWQVPLGNASQNGTPNHWQDNRVDYFLSHMSELAGAHAIGAAFGAGRGDQTTPQTDGGNLISKTKTYVSGGGQALCR
jgi:hypothetical protein